MNYTVGLMTLMNGEIREEVLDLWNYFEQMYESKLAKAFYHPNISYQGGICENLDTLITRLNEFEYPEKFEVEIDGFEKFTKPQNVIYMKIIKNSKLSEFHDELSRILIDTCIKTFDLYIPERWVPHITIVMNDISEVNFHKSFEELCDKQSNRRRVLIENLALVIMDSSTRELAIAKVWDLNKTNKQ